LQTDLGGSSSLSHLTLRPNPSHLFRPLEGTR
jgi:hypothetical protein